MPTLYRPATGPITNVWNGKTSFAPTGHKGIDIGYWLTKPDYRILASCEAPIVWGGWASGSGRNIHSDYGIVIVQDVSKLFGDGARWELIYAHLKENGAGNAVGTPKPGAHIATMGLTGKTGGFHVHLELRRNGIAVDPTPYMTTTAALEVTPITNNPSGDIMARLIRHPNGTITTVGETTFQHHSSIETFKADEAIWGAAIQYDDAGFNRVIANTQVRKAYLLAGISGGGAATVDVEALAKRTEALLADDFARLEASNKALTALLEQRVAADAAAIAEEVEARLSDDIAGINANIDDQPDKFTLSLNAEQ